MKILTVVGARPQFVKAATVSNILRGKGVVEILVHTGQHYDPSMSDIFFEELNIPKPNYNLGVGSMSHGAQTGQMLIELEKIFLQEKPDIAMVYGDTNSTLAGALCASKLLIPVAHIEAGLRSFNKAMPEEQNRIMTDHISKYLFTPTQTAVDNLHKENIKEGIYNVGDVMYDAINMFKEYACKKKTSNAKQIEGDYILATIHRAENTNSKERLSSIFNALNECGEKIVLPLHPRTRKYINDYDIIINENINIIEPVGYLDMILLQDNAKKIITDSGGVQKEAYFLGKPCITIRPETEWVETVQNGWNTIVDSNTRKILEAIDKFNPKGIPENVFGDGHAAEKIISTLMR